MSIYFEDCLNLQKKFPLLYSSFLQGDFVVQSLRKSSALAMDQALEMTYNKHTKGPGGVIGYMTPEENIRIIKSFLDSRSNLLGEGKLSNIATGTELPTKDIDFLLSCYTFIAFKENFKTFCLSHS